MSEHSEIVFRDVASEITTRNSLLKEHLLRESPIFDRLCGLREQVWAREEGDQHFHDRRKSAANPNQKQREIFSDMTVRIGSQMAVSTRVFDLKSQSPLVLDLCMAPGGFTRTTMDLFPDATVHAITLPPDSGGYRVMTKPPRLSITYADITMFAAECGVHTVPSDHTDATNFSMDRPYHNNRYDLIFCGGAVLRSHERAPYRDTTEGARLTLSQLIFAFHRLKPSGNLVLLLHRAETWPTLHMIYTLATLAADVKLFKPSRAHAIKSSFYLIARNVRSNSEEAVNALADWKRRWYQLTFDHPQGSEADPMVDENVARADIDLMLKEFGSQWTTLAQQVWSIQAAALEKFLGSIERANGQV